MLTVNKQALVAQDVRASGLEGIIRESKLDGKTAIQLKTVSNQFKLSELAVSLLKLKAGDVVRLIANFYDSDWSAEVVKQGEPELYAVLEANGYIITGQKLLDNVISKKFKANFTEAKRNVEIEYIKENFLMDELYVVGNILYSYGINGKITDKEYEALSGVEKTQYTKPGFNTEGYTAMGILSKDNSFSSQAWTELGGDDTKYMDEGLTKPIREGKGYKKTVIYNLYPTLIESSLGDLAFLTSNEVEVSTSVERTRKEKSVTDNTDVPEVI